MKVDRIVKVLFVLGGPGCGKGTQCSYLNKQFGFKHFSAGDLLREEVSNETEMAQEINKHIIAGTVVPGIITAKLLKNAIIELSESCGVFVIDGFPRNIENLEAWNSIVDSSIETVGVMFIDCLEENMLKRMLKRAESSGRVDDNEETFKNRISVFNEETSKSLDYFRNLNKCYVLDGNNLPEECNKESKLLIEKLKLKDYFDSHKTIGYLKNNVDPYIKPLMNHLVSTQPTNVLEEIKQWVENYGPRIKINKQ